MNKVILWQSIQCHRPSSALPKMANSLNGLMCLIGCASRRIWPFTEKSTISVISRYALISRLKSASRSLKCWIKFRVIAWWCSTKRAITFVESDASPSPISPMGSIYRMLVMYLSEIRMEIASMSPCFLVVVRYSPSLSAHTSRSRAAADSR